jgi:hypothetical protein
LYITGFSFDSGAVALATYLAKQWFEEAYCILFLIE